ncbi:MAG: DUF1801 domain-containing protein [Bacteroidota bacterium]
MQNVQLKIDPEVISVFNRYPKAVLKDMVALRGLILEVADGLEEITSLEETLKWGEPSYLAKYGSTIRIDWKAKNPEQYAIYFKCTSQLVPTFKTLYTDKFSFEGNRALVFKLGSEVPKKELKHCIAMALRYHKIKHLPLLGA